MQVTFLNETYNVELWESVFDAYISNEYLFGRFSSLTSIGGYIDLPRIYYNTYRRLHESGADFTSDEEIICTFTYDGYVLPEDNEEIFTVQYIYDHSKPDVLYFTFRARSVTTQSLQNYFTLAINYSQIFSSNWLEGMGKVFFWHVKAENTENTNKGDAFGMAIGDALIDTYDINDYPAICNDYGFYWNFWGHLPDELPVDHIMTEHLPTDALVESEQTRSFGLSIPPEYPERSNHWTAGLTCEILFGSDISINGAPYEYPNPDDDYNNPDTSSASYSDVSDSVSLDAMPSLGPLDTGFIKAYLVTPAQCQGLANFMLTDNFLTNVKKLFANPIDYIISLHFLPVKAPASNSTNIFIGGLDSGVSAYALTTNYLDFSCGSIDLDEFWGSFMDYSPLTHVSCYIPFIGVRELNCDDIMTGKLTLNYRINLLDGDFVCTLHAKTKHKLDGIIAQFQGNMLMSTPVTSLDYSNKFTSAFTALTTIPAIAGGSVPASVTGISSAIESTLAKPQIARSGNITGGAGMLGNFTPYLIKTRPKQAMPKFFAKLFGKPSLVGGAVSFFSGYTEFSEVKLDSINCTDNERAEIMTILKGGVFV